MRKKSWKKVLSAILASAMLFTAVPANLTMTVQAQEPGVEDMMPEDSDALTVPVDDEQTVDVDETAENGQNPAGGGTNVGSPAEGTEDVGDTTEDGTEDEGNLEIPDTNPDGAEGTEGGDDSGDADSGDNNNTDPDDGNNTGTGENTGDGTDTPGNTENAEAGAVANGKEITFTCKPTDGFFGSWDDTNKTDVPITLDKVTNIIVRGEKEPGGKWDNLVTLTKGTDGVWTGTWTAPEYGTYTYQFQANNGTYYMLYNNKQNFKINLKDPNVEETYAGPTIDYNPDSSDPGAVTFYFPTTFEGKDVTSVKVKGGWDGWANLIPLEKKEGADLWSVTLPTETFGRDTGVEYGFAPNADTGWSVDNANPNNGNSKLHRNPEISESGDVTLYYYPSHGTYPAKVELKYRKKNTTDYTAVEMKRPENGETAVYQATLSGLEDADFEYYFDVDGVQVQDTNNATTGEFSKAKIPEKDPSVKSPVTADGKTTFNYYGPTAKSVKLAGNMMGESDWGAAAKDMTYNAETGYWSITLKLEPGSYAYKFVVDSAWIADPLNSETLDKDGNSMFIVAGLQVPPELYVKRGGSRTLPVTMKLDDGSGKLVSAAVTYELTAESQAKYADKITLTPETKDGVTTTRLSVAADFPAADKSFTLTASAQGNSSEVTMLVADATYMYTIYYFDPDPNHRSVDNAGLWLWQTSTAGASKQIDFDEVETLEDGNKWLKKTLELGYTDLSFKSRSYGSWAWEDSVNKKYVNEEQKAEVTLYAVTDDSKVYTELPEIVVPEERYLVVEYTRETKKDGKWQLYTWNSGFGGNVWIPFEAQDDILVAKVPVKPAVDSLSFCISRTEGDDPWGEKDGNDYNCSVPADQNIVKIKMEEGKGITYTYPYNTGYEVDIKENKIDFYYRDDTAFLEGSEGGYADVSIDVITPKAHGKDSVLTEKMLYDEKEQRYKYALDELNIGTYLYRYGAKKTQDSTTEYVLDKFNEETEDVKGTVYSALKYDLLNMDMEASVQNATMDYNDNNVVTIKVNAKDSKGKPVEDTSEFKVIDRASIDLSAVGGGVTSIDPELMAISIAVKEGTPAGEKTLPITVYDVYNNEYKTNVKVTVAGRGKGSDFDWDEAVVYFAVTDRFFDGNSSNNEGGVPGSYDKTTNNGLNSSYHGGDFAGLTQKLDYLQDLGVNTIWITPIVENQTVANSVDNPTVTQAWGYTGYWTKDFTKIDAHLGTEAEFSALLDAAHAKGMKVMVDVVLNHTGYGDEITNYYNTNFKNEDGEVIRMLRGDDEVVPGSDQMSSLSGLPDFRTEDPEVRELIVEWQSNWISRYPIDYYRVDTVKHVDATTWSAFKNALTEINPDFKMIGEWAGAGYGTDTGMLNTGRMDALLDFDFPAQAANFVTGDLSGVEGFLSARNGAIDNTASLGAFLSNHDQQGFVHRLTSEKKKPEEEAKQLALVAASLQLTAKGQVYIYYGEEIGVSDGEENYPYQTNRRDFDWSKVTNDNKALAHYKKMLTIRNMYSELFAKGSRHTISADNAGGLDVFTRSYGGDTLTVALNIKNQPQEYTLSGQTPGTALVDYYSGNQFVVDNAGNAVITIPAAADGGTVVLGTEGLKTDLQEGMQIKSIPDQTYTGLSIKLSEEDLQVYHGTAKLVSGRDYTVRYKNNKAVGTATVSIIGRGNYQETETAQFNILPKNITDGDVAVSYHEYMVANGKVQKPLLNITYNNNKVQSKYYQAEYYQLDETGKRISEALKGVKEIGTYEMVITGKTNFTGTVVKTIQVKETGTYMSQTSVTINGLTKNATPYTGKAIEPAVEVKKGGAAVEKECYTVTYRNNVEVGTAQVIVTGVAEKGYFGSVTKNFNITGTALSSVAAVDTEDWQAKVAFDLVKGKAEQPNAVLKVKPGKKDKLTKGTDYTVSYTNNTKPGTATVLFTGKGKYTGVVKKTFKILPITLQQSDLGKNLKVTVAETAPFSKKGAKAAVSVIFKNRKLTENVDYKLTYSANKAVTKENTKTMPSVTIKGMGAFTGTIKGADELKFSIVKADLNDPAAGISVRVSDVVYADQAGKFMAEPEVKEADGTKLVKGSNKDYVVKYFVTENGTETEKTASDKLEAGTNVKVVVSATENSNYTGETSREYRVVKASIGTANIVVKAQTYTGKAITLKEEDFKKVKVGNDMLEMGVDYEIVPGSYKNNVNKGSATVTIRGIGNYGGTRQVMYRISSYMMRWWWNLFG